MPLGYLEYNGKPFGLAVMGRSGDDGLILQFMSAFEAIFPNRRVPPPWLQISPRPTKRFPKI